MTDQTAETVTQQNQETETKQNNPLRIEQGKRLAVFVLRTSLTADELNE